MKQAILLSILYACSSFTHVAQRFTANSSVTSYDIGVQLQEILDRYSRLGIPGISVAVQHGSQQWQGSSGFANIEQQVPLQPSHLMYAQSLAKTYTAVVTMRLVEEGKIELANSIREYLPEYVWKKIEHSEAITVRMLLNHTSGLHDYAYDYKYAGYLLNNGDRVFSKSLILGYILDGKANFYPGNRYSYCNSGYFILAYMSEYLTGRSHAQLIREKILLPLNLNNTFYREEIERAQQELLVNSYLDRFSNGKIENVSQQQLNNILAMMGDDSIIATPLDYILFLGALADGKLLSEESLRAMKQWVNHNDEKPAYGLGLSYKSELNIEGYGHGGSGLGAGCSLYHFPQKDVTVFIGVNISTLIPSSATDALGQMKQEIYKVILGN
jgi:D-alanyl-D-alanine carboxypeptidase